VILVDRLDGVSDAVRIAKRTHRIALQSIIAGMGLSGLAMGFAAFGFLPPVAGALTQEVIDVAVILNALRALSPGRKSSRPRMPAATGKALRLEHEPVEAALDRLREIADALENVDAERADELIGEANEIVERRIVAHERADESTVYPKIAKFLADRHGLGAMSRAHREIIHLARLLRRLADGLSPAEIDHYLVRDAQRIIESIEALVRIHIAQEEDIYEYAAGT
jgi:hemerythrin-like domain-containing protein